MTRTPLEGTSRGFIVAELDGVAPPDLVRFDGSHTTLYSVDRGGALKYGFSTYTWGSVPVVVDLDLDGRADLAAIEGFKDRELSIWRSQIGAAP